LTKKDFVAQNQSISSVMSHLLIYSPHTTIHYQNTKTQAGSKVRRDFDWLNAFPVNQLLVHFGYLWLSAVKLSYTVNKMVRRNNNVTR